MRGVDIRRRRFRGGRPLGWALCALAFCGVGARGDALEEANRLWRGATCTLLAPIEIKSGKDADGWSRSPHYGMYEELERPFFWTFWVSNRSALAPLLRGDLLPPGTVLTAKGWRLIEPERGMGVTLDMRLRDAPVDVRWQFQRRGSFGRDSVPLDRLEQVERYLRIELFEVEPSRPPVELAAPVASSPSHAAARPSTPPAAAATPAPFKPSIEVLAVSARPARAAAGDSVDLVAVYRVAGLPPGTFFEVTERREIFLGDRRLQNLEETFHRAGDEYTSSWTVRLPPTLGPGLYRFVFHVTLAGLRADGESLFEVVP